MRILYFDIDSLRPDHLGCYGYQRETSPNIDALARQGVIVNHLYTSDSPCLPSRTAFFGGRFGTRSGVVNHGGVCADLIPEGPERDFRSKWAEGSLASMLTRSGFWTASISPFPRRHSAYQMNYGFNETIDTGKGGMENAEVIFAQAHRWLRSRAKEDNWFLHVNLWDPHTPYDTPISFGNPFENIPIDGWITEELIARQRSSYGPHSAHEVPHYDSKIDHQTWPWGKGEIKSVADAKVHIDGYDSGILYADEYIGRMVNLIAEAGVLEETAIIVSSDHGENLGELNIWGDHQTADEFTNHIPAIVRWPGVTPRRESVAGFYYHLDLASAIVELSGPRGRDNLEVFGWNGSSMVQALRSCDGGRPVLYLSHGAWSLQRSARWEDWILIHTLDTGIKDFSEWMLYDLAADPHQTKNLASKNPQLIETVGAEMSAAFEEMAAACVLGDPFEQVKREGGPYHAKAYGREWGPYLARLAATGRKHHADWLRENGNAPRPSVLAAY